ncbi:MAG: hypothetical protein PHE56_12075 [Bacteroidales bacterium]|nr:hypothetical protein [Bacteroidales bacterium]
MKKKVLVFIATLALMLAGSASYISAQHDVLMDADDQGGGGGSTYTCSSGGPGSTSCSVSTSGGGGGITGGTTCSVTCGSGYYACCNAWENKCQCRKG